jgi:ankyrin repeat protein
MYKSGIAVIASGLLIVSIIICSASFAQDQDPALVRAAQQGDFKRVQDLLDQGVDVDAKNSEGATALWETVLRAGSKESCLMPRLLLNRGADPNIKDKYGRTVLMWASHHGPVELVTWLLEEGADPNDGVSLPNAVHNEHNLQVVKLLLDKGADVNTKTSDDWTALTLAALDNQINVANLLLDKGARINEKVRPDWTALMWSIYGSHVEMTRLLLERGADVNAKTREGRTALMEAAAADHQIKSMRELYGTEVTDGWGPAYPRRKNDLKIVKLLLQHGADVTAKDDTGWTALKRAKKSGATDIVELLRAQGAKE